MASSKLTAKQSKFVDEYIVCMNGTEAVRRAGYEGDDRTLAVTASRLLRNANVLRALDERLKEFAMPANEVLVQLTDIARGDIADALTPGGAIDVSEAIKRGKSHLIKRIRTKVTTITEKSGDERQTVEEELELYDRQAALNTLAKFHSLLVERFKVDDWRSLAIEEIKAGRIGFNELAKLFDSSLAKELFQQAGVPIDDAS